MDAIIQGFPGPWQVPWSRVLPIVAVAMLYMRGFTQLHSRMPQRFPGWRMMAFLAGTAALLVAIASPLEAFDDLLLSLHMVQHMLLMFVAPPLLLLGVPTMVLLRGLPATVRGFLAPIFRHHGLGRFTHAMTHPVVGWSLMAAATWGWHIPATFELALRSDAWHAVEHGCFFFAAMLFWWPVILPWPSRPHWPRWTMIPYLLLADAQNTALSALLVFGGRVLYPHYAAVPRLGGISALDDQIAAGGIMWVPGSLFFLIPAAATILQLLAPRESASRTWREVADPSEAPLTGVGTGVGRGRAASVCAARVSDLKQNW